MNKTRLDGLYVLLLGAAVCVLLGGALVRIAPAKMSDFSAIFYGARCIIHNSDPYQSNQVLREFQADGGQFPSDPTIARPYQRAILSSINLPTALLLIAPFAFLTTAVAHCLWIILMLGSLLLAGYCVWDIGAAFSPVLAGALVGCVLANSEVLLINGNVAGVAIGLGIAALWCFTKNRFIGGGICCLAVSLALKPHDIGFFWLYLLLTGGILRKRAIQSFVLAAAIGLLAMLWVSHVSPHWIDELHSNLAETSARGDLNDPGPSSMGAHTSGMIVSLQTVVSEFRDDPGFYNLATYLIIGPLILVWAVVTFRSHFSVDKMWLALACISALSLLPVYHRIYDAKLLLLSIPACAMLWARGGAIRWIALAINTIALIVTSDLAWVFFVFVVSRLRPAVPWITDPVLNAMIVFPVPIVLLTMGVFYLWAYARHAPIGQLREVATHQPQ